MKNILIVGGTGFLGFHLAKNLIKNFKVTSISLKKPKKNRKLKKVNYLIADISNPNSLKKIKKKLLKMNYIINFGGYVSHKDKVKVLRSHYYGARNLIKFFLKKEIYLFIQIGSSMEYGKLKSPQKENSIAKPCSFYGKAKLSATKFAYRAYKTQNFPIISLRLYQIYGPHQDTNRLIPFVIDQSIKGKKFPCSKGDQKRDFLYISDFISCVKTIIQSKKKPFGEVFNIGYGKSFNVKNLINSIKKKIKSGKPEFGKISLRNEENKDTFPDLTKIKKVFNWKPKVSINRGLNLTIKFYERK